MAIITAHLREIMFEDQTIVKLNASETIDEVVARLEAQGIAVNVF